MDLEAVTVGPSGDLGGLVRRQASGTRGGVILSEIG